MKALVIGGSGTIGMAITERLLADGFEVVVHYNQADIGALSNQFHGQPVQFVQCDLKKAKDLNEHFGFIENLDCLIYTSGNALYGLLQDMTDVMLDESYTLHLRQLMRVCRLFIDQLRQSQNGRIVVVSSIWGETGASLETVYSAMKAGQIGFVKALSQELALSTVTVNAIAPGIVSGRMTQTFDEETLSEIIQELPQQRLIDPQEIAHTCSYLCHPYAKSITGTVQKVNGAWYL
ncbi:SDR family oxidoreductase [Staphylococcus sp. ACRSN]|uniref:elongation factor P 5-aminopentanone reductase n=1 Tax=Staphylococcus sp. ACRSN TaxID=2918214 RepID=UPI001EF1C08A|nr:SDR family NAD(P)-dependent oxidoreductase [Staphylococcus sp. ACRSN]MCG7339601.1 SDR family oxidoreductase [Staphylococcus sp. ACRSN]